MKRILQAQFIIFVLFSGVFGCAPQPKFHPAPVVNGWRLPAAGRNAYIVQKHDTLYSIAWAFGMDYRDLAAVNHLKPPYKLNRGQKVYIAKPQIVKKASKSKIKAPAKSSAKPTRALPQPSIKKTPIPKASETVPQQKVASWLWPVSGKIVGVFNNTLGGNKGIDLTSRFGAPICASAAGRVVYSGAGIRSYGNLIIIKHNDDYLSAYAYNKRMLVHEGQMVKQGEKIAEMGKNDAGATRLHFEIRRSGKPVNPQFYLPKH